MTSDLFTLSQHQSVNVVELNLPDGMDSAEIDRLNEELLALFKTAKIGGRWILNLQHVEYMASSALGLMVNVRHKVKAIEGKLALCNMSPRLLQIFKTCCLEKLFTISKSVEDAVKAVR